MAGIKAIREFNLNYVDVDDLASVTVFQTKQINKLKALAEKYPEDVKMIAKNADGTYVFHLKKGMCQINFGKRERTGRRMSDEERAKAAERLKLAREKKAQEKMELEVE